MTRTIGPLNTAARGNVSAPFGSCRINRDQIPEFRLGCSNRVWAGLREIPPCPLPSDALYPRIAAPRDRGAFQEPRCWAASHRCDRMRMSLIATIRSPSPVPRPSLAAFQRKIKLMAKTTR